MIDSLQSSGLAIQRLGTTFLPAQVVSWRYQRGRRFLEETLAGPRLQLTQPETEQEKEEEVKDA